MRRPQRERGLCAGQRCALYEYQLRPARLGLLDRVRPGRAPRAVPEPVRPGLPGPQEAGGDLP